jgi:protein-tyrosine phosphatase
MGLKISRPLYYYPHYYYIYLRCLLEYYIPFANKNDLHEVYPDIYVGNISTAYNKDKLKEHDITHVISAVSGMSHIYPGEFEYMIVDVLDIKKQNMLPVFDDTSDFIDKALTKKGKVYVHCMCGVSRSVTIVCAYLANKYKVKPLDALKMIKGIRSVANPNPSFLQQLQNYYLQLNKDGKDEEIEKIIEEMESVQHKLQLDINNTNNITNDTN